LMANSYDLIIYVFPGDQVGPFLTQSILHKTYDLKYTYFDYIYVFSGAWQYKSHPLFLFAKTEGLTICITSPFVKRLQ